MKVLLLLTLVVLTAPVWGMFAIIAAAALLVLALKPIEWLIKR